MERQSLVKKAKVVKPVEDPKVPKLKQQNLVSEASVQHLEEPVNDLPPETPDLSTDHITVDPLNTEPASPFKLPETHVEDVVITGTGFRESGNPTILAKHSAKEELTERRKVRFDIANYSQLSISEVLSGYLNQVHTSRDLEIDMVKQMHRKYEV